MSEFRLPSGKYTISRKRYVSEWFKITRKLEKILDAECISFDPSIQLHQNGGFSRTVDIPLWAAKNIIASVEKK